MARNELSVNLQSSRRNLAAGQRILENTLIARKRVLGAEHAYTLWSMNDLAKVYSTRHRHESAIELLQAVLPVARRTLGDSHVGVFMTESNLVRAYVLAEHWAEAEVLIDNLRKKTPNNHPNYMLLVSGFVYVLISTERLAQAETECIRALGSFQKSKGALQANPQATYIAQYLALIYQKQGRQGEFETLRTKFPTLGTVHEVRFNI